MDYNLVNALEGNTGDCLVLGILANQPFSDSVAKLDKQLNGLISQLIKKLHNMGDIVCQAEVEGSSILIIHCGDQKSFNAQTLTKRVADITNLLIKQHVHTATVHLPQLADHDADAQLHLLLVEFDHCLYQLLDLKSINKKPNTLKSLHFFMPNANQDTIHHAEAEAIGIRLTRNLANLPANICTPTYIAKQAQALAEQHSDIKTKIMDKAAIEKMGMGSFLSVAKGSIEPPQFIEIQYLGKSNKPPIVLVGKGVTFDSGGISIKPSSGMEEMKYDMAGAASVLGVIKACALQQLPIHVIGLIPTTENMPSGSATKPGDVVTSMSGQTIEIVNTDAEGRLILADALTYAEQFKPEFVIDIATLTGAAIVALGHETSALLTPDDALAEMILNASKKSGDATWRLPLHDAYQESINSPIADIVNSTADRSAGTITAACFLSRFTQNYRWAHLDVAGTAWISGKNRNATGRPVPLLLEILNHVAHTR